LYYQKRNTLHVLRKSKNTDRTKICPVHDWNMNNVILVSLGLKDSRALIFGRFRKNPFEFE
jgi:hypothetical protein